ncbi:hypothetical protein HX866_26855 [Pseudomonas gingeri]|uniref:hypothetical protein n=1 Tax=Pseudomonas gingeri TaxID=117681 RepID=UPI0015A120D0|nr:hypothetical protein [Pseudomonas gingeri]NWA28517.1 hypothetical protein [Pseudomonas gingeri]
MNNFARSLTLTITNTSGVDMIVNYGTLTGGTWEAAPIPGTLISPTDQQSYVNGASNTFTSLGGTLLLTPANGGMISPNWNWPAGSLPSGSAMSANTVGFTVSSQLIGMQTNNVTLQVIISNAVTVKNMV